MRGFATAAPAHLVSALVVAANLLTACASLEPVETEDPRASVRASATSAASTPSLRPTPEPAQQPGAAAGLALIRPVDGSQQIFVIGPDGSARQVSGLTQETAIDAAHPLWSPDRSRIAFVPRPAGSGIAPRLWVVNADGSDARPLADVGESITWSPDSSMILFEDSMVTTDTSGEPARIWTVDVDSGDVTQLGRGNVPAWLPSGDEISYVPVGSSPQEQTVPFVVAPLGGGPPRPLVRATGIAWSPDGASLLIQQPDGLYLMDVDGSQARPLIGGYSPVWSPDGTRIVYAYGVTQEEALPIIGVVDLDGTVLWSGAIGSEPVWSPDGTKLAVEVGFPDISIQVLDATTGQPLLELEGQDPAW